MNSEQYRKHLVAEARILELSELKPDPKFWSDAEHRECLTLRWIAQFNWPANTVLTEEQFWKILDRRYPEGSTTNAR